MTLSLDEFPRFFCLHILLPRFVKIRYYGLHANRGRSARLAKARDFLAKVIPAPQMAEAANLSLKHVEPSPLVCPRCGRPTLVLVGFVYPPKPAFPISDTS